MTIAAPTAKSPSRLQKKSLVGEVRMELERMILEGELRSGERLNENDLAGRFGVSRGPVREAARFLQHDGLVDAIAHEGVYVRTITLEEALDLYDLRAVLAGHICACLASRATAADKVELRDFIARMAAASAEAQAYVSLNFEFHTRIAQMSGAERAAAIYTSLGKEVRLMRLRVLLAPDATSVSCVEHERIVAAIEAGDADAARHEGTQHHLNGKARLKQTF